MEYSYAHLYFVHDCSYAAVTKFSSCNGDSMVCNPKIFTVLSFAENIHQSMLWIITKNNNYNIKKNIYLFRHCGCMISNEKLRTKRREFDFKNLPLNPTLFTFINSFPSVGGGHWENMTVDPQAASRQF